MNRLERRQGDLYRGLWALALLAVVTLWAGSAQAGNEEATQAETPDHPRVSVIQAEPSDTAPTVRVVQAMRVVRDAETGELRAPTAQEMTRFQRADAGLDRRSEGLEEVQRAGTTVTVDLQGRFLSASVVTVDAAGTVHGSCVDAPQQAETVLTGDADELEAARQEVRNER
ncbi:MAG: hypothetical protein SX243_25515 [Acidobacteriota bacterium]|nr:hypothetical protein [Acidobacteriota bacterium]